MNHLLTPNIYHLKAKKGFTLLELLVVIAIIGILTAIGLNNFSSARQKARDTKRKTDLKQIANALEAYYNDHGQYPASDINGNILGCETDATETCSWGSSAFKNTTTGTVYMVKLPTDPYASRHYYYEADQINGLYTRFRLYARLENTLDPKVPKDKHNNPEVYSNTNCGNIACNYGISSPNTTPEDNNHNPTSSGTSTPSPNSSHHPRPL